MWTDDFMDDAEIIEAENKSDQAEHLLPVHFLPEGKKCYDWIQKDVEKDDEERAKNRNQSARKKILNNKSYGVCETSSTSDLIQQSAIGLNAFDPAYVETFLEAAEDGNLTEVVRLLDESPALLNCCDSDLYTALHRASYNGRTEVMKVLIERGANIAAKTEDGWHPLHSACRWNQIEAAFILLQNGGDVNAQSNGGQTPLHLASTLPDRAQLLEMLLLQKNVDIRLKNHRGDTAYDIAFRNGPHYKLFEIADESINTK